ANLEKATEAAEAIKPANESTLGGPYYVSDETDNSFLLINELEREPERYRVYRLVHPAKLNGRSYAQGGFVVEMIREGEVDSTKSNARNRPGSSGSLAERAARLGITIESVGRLNSADLAVRVLKPGRLGLYKSWAPSMDEGWTRWVLEQFRFDYTSIADADIKAGDLKSKFDAIIVPDQSAELIIRGNRANSYPEEYTGGIGETGVENLRRFVEAGGTLVCIDSASELALLHFKLPIKNALSG